ncbi:MAG: hypothetical protein M5U01_33040 [Ardenticatenaceae bacterium]|nr:hypothetical protein [Ardenticatenaceae bacterium]HBY99584.1 hypothetical protein [Chloroflexota bacterium]
MMGPRETSPDIRCPINLFPRQEAEIARLSQAINQAPTAPEKVPWAHTLAEAADILLACQVYDDASLDCRLCRLFSEVRCRTAALVVKAGGLGTRRRL